MIRDNLEEKFPRQHYNKNNIAKMQFKTEKDALEYIKRKKLKDYTAYKCQYCHFWHIGKKKNQSI